MGTYSVEQAIELWRVGKLTVEQAIGQFLQFVRQDRERMNEIERRLKRVNYSPRSIAEGERREPTPQTRPVTNAARRTPDE
jgi:hypothetical protein